MATFNSITTHYLINTIGLSKAQLKKMTMIEILAYEKKIIRKWIEERNKKNRKS
jgi:hypothetical protein